MISNMKYSYDFKHDQIYPGNTRAILVFRTKIFLLFDYDLYADSTA